MRLECVALATGMKCLPRNKLEQVKGNVLHDSHAEVLAIRAFNRFLVDECHDLARGVLGECSAWVRWRRDQEHTSRDRSAEKPELQDIRLVRAKQTGEIQGAMGADSSDQPFCLRDGVGIYMFCSEAPCGDASMELTMADQEDATPWTSRSLASEQVAEDMQGRGHFDRLGVVRRKPSRPDAPPTWSKSCSDKLALKQCTSLLSSLTSRLVSPGNVYLSSLVLPEHQYVSAACERAFGSTGRMKSLVGKQWEGDFAYRPFIVQTTSAGASDFEFSKRVVARKAVELVDRNGTKADELAPVASNLSSIYTARKQEKLINGILEGRKFPDPKGASSVSRREMWKALASLAQYTEMPSLDFLVSPESKTYGDIKKLAKEQSSIAQVKADVVEVALRGWRRNDGDDDWSLSKSDEEEIVRAGNVLT